MRSYSGVPPKIEDKAHEATGTSAITDHAHALHDWR
jgi:hypothetical protein